MALKHAQELAGQVKLAAAANKGKGVEMQEQVCWLQMCVGAGVGGGGMGKIGEAAV